MDLERAVPGMATVHENGVIEEAVLDVTCWFPGSTLWLAFDVTVRFAGATRYVGSDRTPGAAAARAEREKHRRYGQDVLPLAFESNGRLGDEEVAALQRVADVAAGYDAGTETRRGLQLRWRRRLETALFFATADCIQCALDGDAGGRSVLSKWCAPNCGRDTTASGTPEDVQVPCIEDLPENLFGSPAHAVAFHEDEAATTMHGGGPDTPPA